MTKQEMTFLSDALHTNNIEHETREDYSGRAMYGKKTCGIVLEDPTCLIHCVALFMYDGGDPPEELLERFDGFRTDSMGLGTIVY